MLPEILVLLLSFLKNGWSLNSFIFTASVSSVATFTAYSLLNIEGPNIGLQKGDDLKSKTKQPLCENADILLVPVSVQYSVFTCVLSIHTSVPVCMWV